ncbi:metal ABC transporter substrate-binding protein [Herpetosiphon geysericola]|uniref:metal ABC transporter substrate-binding protein n=1 Tax=Herpetosiphon geysericola TaxID=70996 RepID=UPI0006C902A2|nr:metal ABC transporter substrate-binding protein [Herpetosiphon geysericola]
MRRYSFVLLLVILVGCGQSTATVQPSQISQSQQQTTTADQVMPTATAIATEPVSQIRVVTTMSILADVIKQVGGDRVIVDNIIPLGAGPEDYQATPGDSQKIADANIVFFNGHALEEWLEPLFENAGGSEQPRIELSAGFVALEDEHAGEEHADEEHSDEHAHEEGNPHFWLDPTYVMSYTVTIRDQLSAIDPSGKAVYAANAESYLGQLEALDQELQGLAAQIPAERRKLITNHDAFPYFAKRYGFEVAGVLLENPEAELSAGDLSTLIESVKASGVPAIFSESQFNQKTAQLLADEAGIKTIAVLYTDTLGSETATSYIAMMRYNMNTIVAALK